MAIRFTTGFSKPKKYNPFSRYWRFREWLAKKLITLIRKYIIPSGHSYKYALKLEILDKVNASSLKW